MLAEGAIKRFNNLAGKVSEMASTRTPDLMGRDCEEQEGC